MDFDDYQAAARRTARYPRDRYGVIYPSLGLCGEAGEVAEKVKRHIRSGEPLDREGVVKELGDVLWYLSMVADDLGVPLSEVARRNVEKLGARAERGVIHGSGDDR